MGWLASVDAERLHQIMTERGADYLMLYDWRSLDSPRLFEQRVDEVQALFQKQAEWDGIVVYQRLEQAR